MNLLLLFTVLNLLFVSSRSDEDTQDDDVIDDVDGAVRSNRKGHDRALSLFQIVRFPNDPCRGGDNKNGTCYTDAECSAKSGTNAGSCAQGFGVCCTFSVTCGATSNENCTYFQSTTTNSGACQIRICPCGDNICQLRLDFNAFMITGPSTSTLTALQALNGVASNFAVGAPSSLRSQCLTDTFSVSSASGTAPPTICGTNTGEHMYVDSDAACNNLNFALGSTAMGVGALATRQWDIKVTQYSCDYNNLAPDGCTQYFFGSSSQQVKTFNFDGGQHLANQDQNICVRREGTNCRICWTTAIDTDFAVSHSATMMAKATGGICCGHGATGMSMMGFDCLVLPGAINPAMTSMVFKTQFCGNLKGVGTNNIALTVCTDRQPFNVRFLSDSFEAMAEALIMPMQGFRLTYFQTSTGC